MMDILHTQQGAALHMLTLHAKIVVLALAMFALLKVFKTAAAWRHLVWFALFITFLVLPLLNGVLPQWHIPIITIARVELSTLPKAMPEIENSRLDISSSSLSPIQTTSQQTAPEQKSFSLHWQNIKSRYFFLLLWILGVALFQLRYIIGHVHLIKWHKTARVANDNAIGRLRKQIKRQLNLTQRIDILVCDKLHTPLATGFFRHRILLPTDYQQWHVEHLKYVLLHEAAHIKRRDMLTQCVVHFISSLFWFNPAVWFAHKQFVSEREQACDELVVKHSSDPQKYANMLLQFAQKMVVMPRIAYAGLSMARSSQLEGRLLAILNQQHFPTSKKSVISTVALSACLIVSILGFSPFAVGDTQTTIDTTHTALVIESLKYALNDDDGDVRENAVRTLGKINTEKSNRLLYSALLTSNDWHVEVNAAKILLQRGEIGALEKFTRQLFDDNVDVRKRSAKILRELKHPLSLIPLTKAMNENNDHVRQHVVRALSELRLEGAIKPLRDAITDENVEIRRIAAWGLGETENAKALTPLYKALDDLDGKVRCNATESIGDIKQPASVEYVLPLLTDREWFVRREAIRVLAELQATQAVPGIIDALHDEHKKVRQAAADALGELGDRRALVPLSAALHDKSDDVRKRAANALGEFFKEK